MQRKTKVNLLVISLIILAGSTLAFGSPTERRSSQSVNSKSATIDQTSDKKSLQLRSFKFSKPSLSPQLTPQITGTACNHDNMQLATKDCSCPAFHIRCNKGKCVSINTKNGPMPCTFLTSPGYSILDEFCSLPDNVSNNPDYYVCFGKPVIYLYPVSPMNVNVSIKTSGSIIISDPQYPAEGWKNVLAFPNGTLLYKGNEYKELFYETSVTQIRKPTKGITIPMNTLSSSLDSILTQLGLIEHERKEFLEFWVPKLYQLNTPYVWFGLIDTDEKKRIDHVIIDPKPDTQIEILGYFKPLDIPSSLEALILPKNPPQRVGFTAVEWGATIDTGTSMKLQ